jgi:putative ABC transport system ATP-binding protein
LPRFFVSARLVVYDEPTAALDHATGEAVVKLVAANAVHPDRAAVVVNLAALRLD